MSLIILVLLVLIIVAACAQARSTPTGSPSPALTAGQLAELGQVVFDRDCRECHVNADGPNVDLWLKTYSNARQMYDHALKTMPPSSPGGLKAEEYLQVVAWVLVEYQVVPADTPLNITALASIDMPK